MTGEGVKVRLSIIIPAYNAEIYIERCLQSIIKDFQEKDCEVILINDGSTDHTEEIARRFSEKYRAITYYNQENAGVSEARNHGLRRALGEYILFVDADDILLDGGLKTILASLTSDSDIIVFNYMEIDEQGRVKSKINIAKDAICLEQLNLLFLSGHYLNACWAKAFKKSIIESEKLQFNKTLKIGEDLAFVADYMEKVTSYLAVKEYVYGYRQTNIGVMNASRARLTEARLHDIEMEIIRKRQFLENASLPKEAYDKFYDKYAEYLSASIHLMLKERRTLQVEHKECNALLKREAVLEVLANAKKNRTISGRRRVLMVILENKLLRQIYLCLKHVTYKNSSCSKLFTQKRRFYGGVEERS